MMVNRDNCGGDGEQEKASNATDDAKYYAPMNSMQSQIDIDFIW